MEQTYQEKIIVLFSGGQDSTTLLFWAKKHFKETIALSVNYGQRHSVELEQAKKITKIAGTEHFILDFDLYKTFSSNSLTDPMQQVEKGISEGLPNTFVPGRNYFFLGIAAAFGYERNISHIAIGANQIDYSGYPDCREDFLLSTEEALSYGLDRSITIHSPLLFLDKMGIWKLAEELGILDLIINETHTCYNGVRTKKHPWGYGCGECPACLLRKEGFEKAFSKI